MGYKLSWHYNFGRIVCALILMFIGLLVLNKESHTYVPILEAWKQSLIPNFAIDEKLYHMAMEAEGALFILAGLLILVNCRVIGGIMALVAITFMVACKSKSLKCGEM